MPRQSRLDPFLLQAALNGLELQHQWINEQIAQVRAMLGRRRVAAVQPTAATPKKRTLSLAARRRIAAAQRKRWAEFRKQQREKTSAPAARRPMKRAVRIKAAGKKEAG